ncbi:MAG: hypothetical protein ACRYF5_19550 [Janthinobacterium lividum]
MKRIREKTGSSASQAFPAEDWPQDRQDRPYLAEQVEGKAPVARSTQAALQAGQNDAAADILTPATVFSSQRQTASLPASVAPCQPSIPTSRQPILRPVPRCADQRTPSALQQDGVQTLQPPLLNNDVLDVIASHLPASDLCSLAQAGKSTQSMMTGRLQFARLERLLNDAYRDRPPRFLFDSVSYLPHIASQSHLNAQQRFNLLVFLVELKLPFAIELNQRQGAGQVFDMVWQPVKNDLANLASEAAKAVPPDDAHFFLSVLQLLPAQSIQGDHFLSKTFDALTQATRVAVIAHLTLSNLADPVQAPEPPALKQWVDDLSREDENWQTNYSDALLAAFTRWPLSTRTLPENERSKINTALEKTCFRQFVNQTSRQTTS